MNQQNPQSNQPWQNNGWQPPNPPPQQPWQANQWQPPVPWPPKPQTYQAGRGELFFGAWILIFSIFLCNSIVYAGFSLGFAIGAVGIVAASALYLLCSRHRPGWYSACLLLMSTVIAAGFARSDDGFVKFVMTVFLVISANLGLCLQAKQNRRDPGSIRSLLDAPRAACALGWGDVGKSTRGLRDAARRSGSAGKVTGSVVLGLIIALPLIGVMVFLLMRADAAFEGLMDLLPDSDWSEPIISVLIGGVCALVLYSRGVALHKREAPVPSRSVSRGMSPLTVNTVLAAVCAVYMVYLLSQLAYFTGSFSGILPEDYTLSEYARRGFFEMAWLCAINLSIVWFAVGLVRKEPKTPLSTRLLCLFIGLITIFLAADASMKMSLYIGSYGLTRLRLMTEVVIVFLGLTTAVVCLWLFVPKLPYMKLVMVLALVIGAATFWADVDTQVAKYNVEAYRSGKLEFVDVGYLSTLNAGAVPYVQLLTGDEDPVVAETAQNALKQMLEETAEPEDFRQWNWATRQALEYQK